ncbi:MAG: 5-formyltetrahydrofolate cyclo-ligase [Hyphomicrobiaceae bacterium]
MDDATSPIVVAKRLLRDEAKARRAAIPVAERVAAASNLAERGLDFLPGFAPASVVSGFLAIGEEINPGPLMTRLHRDGATICLPVMVGKGRPLEFRAWAPGAPLRTVVWGIREPHETAPLVEPDVLLVPLLAFDRTGARLGYGGGFYDRTLHGLRSRKPVVTIGLGYAGQEVDVVPHLDYDERLDWVLTPEGPIRCSL